MSKTIDILKHKKMKILLTFSFLLIFVTSYAQQFNFSQLIEMTNDNKVFEINMIKALNQMFKNNRTIGYSYTTIDGTIGASKKLPSNDAKYEPKYKFDDGKIYTNSEIEDKKLDKDFEIRNKLRNDGKLINQLEVDSFEYLRSKINSLIKSQTINIGFAENYNSEEKIATTWYTWESHYYKKVLEQSEFFSPNYKKSTVEFVRDTEFSTILKQIIAVSKFIDIKDEGDSFIANYKYGKYVITSERRENGHGGIITIYFEQK